jgi:TPR repeat protein
MNKYHILKDGQNLGPYFIDEIRARLNNGELVPDDLAWTEGMAEWQPVRTLLSQTPSSPPPPSQTTQADGTAKKNESLATIALMLPLGGAVLNWFWVGGMNLLQGPESSMNLIMVAVIIGTAILIGMEAGNLGMGGPDDPTVKAGKKATSPVGWGVGTALLWIAIFPAYMFHRSKFGVRNHLAVALLVMVLFLGSVFLMFSAIEDKKDEVRRAFHTADSALSEKSEPVDVENPKPRSDVQDRTQKDVSQSSQKAATSREKQDFKSVLAKAKSGDASSQSSLSVMYANGEGVTKDEAEAKKWMLKAAAQNDVRAQRNLYLMLSQALGVPKDEKEALKWLQKVVEQGDAEGEYYFGIENYGKKNLPADIVKAYAWVRAATLNGYTDENVDKKLFLFRDRMNSEQMDEAEKLVAQIRLNPAVALRTAPTNQSKEPSEEIKSYSLGEDISLGGFTYRVTGIKKMKQLKDGELVDSEAADLQTKLFGELLNTLNEPSDRAKGSAEINEAIKNSPVCVFVEYSIRNDGATAHVVSVADFHIDDAKGRHFSPSSALTAKLAMEQDADFLFKELQPGVRKSTGQIFELPSDSFDGKLTLVIPQKGFLSKGRAEVSIHTPSQREADSQEKNTTAISSTGKRRAGIGAKLRAKSTGELFVESFTENSTAQQAGLLVGDEIVSVNGERAPTIESFRQIMSQRTAGDKVDLVVMRQGQRKVLQIVLVALPDLKPASPSDSQAQYTTTNCPLRFGKNPRTNTLQALLLGPYNVDQLLAIVHAMEENKTENYSLPLEISKQPSLQGFNKVRLRSVDNPGSNSPLYGRYQILSGAGITVYGEKIDSFGHRDGDIFFEYWRNTDSKSVLVQLDGQFTSQQLKYIISMFSAPENFTLSSGFLGKKG